MPVFHQMLPGNNKAGNNFLKIKEKGLTFFVEKALL